MIIIKSFDLWLLLSNGICIVNNFNGEIKDEETSAPKAESGDKINFGKMFHFINNFFWLIIQIYRAY
jgi:hypothetical protein